MPKPKHNPSQADLLAGEITAKLPAAAQGDLASRRWILEQLHTELLCTARRLVSQRKGPGQLRPEEIISETFLRLMGGAFSVRGDRHDILRYAARAMRNLLLDRARSAGRQSAVEMGSISFSGQPLGDEQEQRVVAVLEEIHRCDPEAANYADLKYFAGLTDQQILEHYGEFTQRSVIAIRKRIAGLLHGEPRPGGAL